MLRVLNNQQLDEMKANNEPDHTDSAIFVGEPDPALLGYIKQRFTQFVQQKHSNNIYTRILDSLKAYKGEYTDAKLAEIQEFGGSEAYAKVTLTKCRGAHATLREIYLGGDRPWDIDPSPEPKLPEQVQSAIGGLMGAEIQNMALMGQQVSPEALRRRSEQLLEQARVATQAEARKKAQRMKSKLEDILVEGKFYITLDKFLKDLTVYPYAVMKGPVVEQAVDVRWGEQGATVNKKPRIFWRRVSPSDFYWDLSVDDYQKSDVIEHVRYTRSDLSSLVGLPGYDDDSIREILEEFGASGLDEWHSWVDSAIRDEEDRRGTEFSAHLIHGLQFQGYVQGKWLKEFSVNSKYIKEEWKDYHATVWVVGNKVIKAQLNPNPRDRHNYYMTSLEEVPGGTVGFGLPELISDMQDTMNSTMRAIQNNMAIASGPQVVVNDAIVSPAEDGDELYPWKRWHYQSDPTMPNAKGVEFFQPGSITQELLYIFDRMSAYTDDVSGIPKYMSGNPGGTGGAGRTASGLSMLMGASSKILQSIATNVDTHIMHPMLNMLFDYVMLTDSEGVFSGDEQIVVRGVRFAQQQETQRLRSLEFLQLTANPIDSQIIGTKGRAAILKEVADRLGLKHVDIVPSIEEAELDKHTPDPNPAGTVDHQKSAVDQAKVNQAGDRPESPMSGMMRGPSGQTV